MGFAPLNPSYGGYAGCLRHTLDLSNMNDQQLVPSGKLVQLRLNTQENGAQLSQAQITDTQVNDPGWWVGRHDAVGEIRIIGDDGEIVSECVVPDHRVGPGIVVVRDERSQGRARARGDWAGWHR